MRREILASKPSGIGYRGEKIVLCKVSGHHPFVTWRADAKLEVFTNGDYFKSYDEALEAFNRRA